LETDPEVTESVSPEFKRWRTSADADGQTDWRLPALPTSCLHLPNEQSGPRSTTSWSWLWPAVIRC